MPYGDFLKVLIEKSAPAGIYTKIGINLLKNRYIFFVCSKPIFGNA